MPIDARILLEGRPIQLENHMDNLIKAHQTYNTMMENKLMARKIQAVDDESSRSNMLSSLAKSSTDTVTGQIDNEKLKNGLLKGGFLKEANDFSQQEINAQEQQRLVAMDKIERGIRVIDYGIKKSGMVNDQAGWSALRQELIGLSPEAASGLPEQYSAEGINQFRDMALTAKDKVMQHQNELEFAYRQQNDKANRDVIMLGQEQSALNQQQNFKQRDRAIEATRINKPLSPQQQKASDAQEMLGLIEQAKPLLGKSTASGIGSAVDTAQGYFGGSNEGANAASALQVIGANMVSKIPKPPGAQSDAELKQAQIAAGRLGDPSVPTEQKKAALNEIIAINERQIKRAKEAGMIIGSEQPTDDPFTGFTPEEKAEYLQEYGGQ